MDKRQIALGAKIELARREFFFYCNLKAPDFYKKNRQYLIEFCKDLQEFYEGDDEVLVASMPPHHGKSRTAGLFVEWVLGKNQNEKVMTGHIMKLYLLCFLRMLETQPKKKRQMNISQFIVIFSPVSL